MEKERLCVMIREGNSDDGRVLGVVAGGLSGVLVVVLVVQHLLHLVLVDLFLAPFQVENDED